MTIICVCTSCTWHIMINHICVYINVSISGLKLTSLAKVKQKMGRHFEKSLLCLDFPDLFRSPSTMSSYHVTGNCQLDHRNC